MAASLQATRDVPNRKQVFIPQETPDHPFDITLVAEDGKEFKAHRRVLSEASPFFEKLLNSDMRESNEGVVRLEMLTELCSGDILEFIYTGSVQISAEENAQDLIAMADYLVLPHLKTLAEKCLVKNLKLNHSNSLSTYYFAETYRCEDLIFVSKQFILANFITVAKTEEFLNLSSKEVKMWISSDEINIGAEEEVFTLILTWIDREKSERNKYFPELFREVRLIYVSREYLLSDIVTNDLVNNNEGCMDLVTDALKNMKFIDAKNRHHLRVKPRKSLETPVILFRVESRKNPAEILACYNPREDVWSRFDGTLQRHIDEDVICFHGELYSFAPSGVSLLRYDAFSNHSKSIPCVDQRAIRNIFVRNEEEIYVLSVSVQGNDNSKWLIRIGRCHSHENLREIPDPFEKYRYHLTKYKPESNSWEDITSFDMGSRVMMWVVAKDNFVYFLGGMARRSTALFGGYCLEDSLTEADRYDLTTDMWDKIADLCKPRYNDRRVDGACGAVAYGKIFIAGGTIAEGDRKTCEVYEERANEWHVIEPSLIQYKSLLSPHWVCADGRLFTCNRFINRRSREDRTIECYDPDSDLWKEVTQIPVKMLSKGRKYFVAACYSMRLLAAHDLHKQAFSRDSSARPHKRPLHVGKRK